MDDWTFKSITILPGTDKAGKPEGFDRLTLKPGDVLSIVGPTGCGKTTFINDLELFARGDTITRRHVLVNDAVPSRDFTDDASRNPIALITQNTKCLADLSVHAFLTVHARARKITSPAVVTETVGLANKFTGEPIDPESKTTTLSGGQTRAMLIADAIVIGNAPVILLDEIENAGIFKDEALAEIKRHKKAVIFVTHDPSVSLLSDRRLVMKNGAVVKIIEFSADEDTARDRALFYDRKIAELREHVRQGKLVSKHLLAELDRKYRETDMGSAEPAKAGKNEEEAGI